MATKEPTYTPPFTVTDEMTSLVADITEVIDLLSANETNIPSPRLRKENRIKTIHSSLAIEHNSLSLEQVTAIIEGKRVLGPPNEVQEVRNAIDAYNLLLELNPYKAKDLLRAHQLMMANLVKENGQFRNGNVGVFDGDRCIHLGVPPMRVPSAISELLEWVKLTKTHPLISSCVFHYEFEFIHPFADGNGRLGRMWQTLLLMQWKPIFAWIPVETIVKQHQQEYYNAIAQSDSVGNSTVFITFMLKCLKESLSELQASNQKSDQKTTQKTAQKTTQKILSLIQQKSNITRIELAEACGISPDGIKWQLKKLQAAGLIRRVGPDKGGHWEIINNEPLLSNNKYTI